MINEGEVSQEMMFQESKFVEATTISEELSQGLGQTEDDRAIFRRILRDAEKFREYFFSKAR